MKSVRIGISTQTPLLRFTAEPEPISSGSGSVQLLTPQTTGVHYQLTPGGVCRMVLPSVRQWIRSGFLKEAHWFSLQPEGPRNVTMAEGPIHLHHLALAKDQLAAYARTKEKLWSDIHGLATPRFDVEDFRFYARYNWFNSDALLERLPDIDLAYVHDFQLLQVGALVGLGAPTVFRWHVPFVPQRIPKYTRTFLAKGMEDFDAVIVSTRRDLEGLLHEGFRGVARQLYPHIDPSEWNDVSATEIAQFEERLGLQPDDDILLCVARMDPVKRQDLAIRALKKILPHRPRTRLVLVGNGSFSGSVEGGLGLSKSHEWAQGLKSLVRELGLERHVVFAHWLPNELVAAAYARSQLLLLPSDIEGFGLTVLEGWRYGCPAVVSSGCGVAEVVQDGLNGRVFPPGDVDRFAQRLEELLSDSEKRLHMGQACRASLYNFDVRRAAPREAQVLEDAIEAYRGD